MNDLFPEDGFDDSDSDSGLDPTLAEELVRRLLGELSTLLTPTPQNNDRTEKWKSLHAGLRCSAGKDNTTYITYERILCFFTAIFQQQCVIHRTRGFCFTPPGAHHSSTEEHSSQAAPAPKPAPKAKEAARADGVRKKIATTAPALAE